MINNLERLRNLNKFDIFKNSHAGKQKIYKAVVVDNKTILEDGIIKIALIGGKDYPYEFRDGVNTNTFNFHKSLELINEKDKWLEEEENSVDKTWGEVSSIIVNCFLSSPIGGSFQNSGFFSCPPINSKGLTVKIDGDYFWLCGIFEPIIRKRQEDGSISDIFIPFPSNIPQTDGIDMDEFLTPQGLKNKADSFTENKLNEERILELKNNNQSVSNLTLLEAGTSAITDRAKNIVLFRSVYPGGDAVKNINTNRDDFGKIKETDVEKIKNEYNRSNYPSETLWEISGKRFWVHKANKWITNNIERDLEEIDGDTQHSNLGINKNYIETKWIDFSIDSLYGLDRFPHPENKLKTLPIGESDENKIGLGLSIDQLNGVGFSINDISGYQSNERKRNINYDTSDSFRKSLYNENKDSTGKKGRCIDFNISNTTESTKLKLDLKTINKSEYELSSNFTIDLDNNEILFNTIKSNELEEYKINIDLNLSNNLLDITNINNNGAITKQTNLQMDSKNNKIILDNDDGSQNKTTLTMETGSKASLELSSTTGTSKIDINTANFSLFSANNTTFSIKNDTSGLQAEIEKLYDLFTSLVGAINTITTTGGYSITPGWDTGFTINLNINKNTVKLVFKD